MELMKRDFCFFLTFLSLLLQLLQTPICVVSQISLEQYSALSNVMISANHAPPPPNDAMMCLKKYSEYGFCEMQDGNLTFLNLNLVQQGGVLSSDIGKLSHLAALHMIGSGPNGMSGTIPTEIGRLTALTRLWLHLNNLSGLVPGELCLLSNLEHLALYGNRQLIGTAGMAFTRCEAPGGAFCTGVDGGCFQSIPCCASCGFCGTLAPKATTTTTIATTITSTQSFVTTTVVASTWSGTSSPLLLSKVNPTVASTITPTIQSSTQQPDTIGIVLGSLFVVLFYIVVFSGVALFFFKKHKKQQHDDNSDGKMHFFLVYINLNQITIHCSKLSTSKHRTKTTTTIVFIDIDMQLSIGTLAKCKRVATNNHIINHFHQSHNRIVANTNTPRLRS
jgi:hypothetical protein